MQILKVSVIIPIYNAEVYLKQCLDSVLSQTLQDIEIICVDDGSTDNSIFVLKEYEKKDSRFIVLEQKNMGAGAARNNGMSIAKGEYLSFLDADDFFESTMLEVAYVRAKKYDADICAFRSDMYDTKYAMFEKAPRTINSSLLPSKDFFSLFDIPKNSFDLMKGWAWDKLFKKDFIKEHLLLFQTHRTTNDLFFVFAALISAKKITVSNEVLAHYRKSYKTSLSTTREHSWHCFYDALIELKRYMVYTNVYEHFKVHYCNYALHFSLWQLTTLSHPEKELLYNKLKDEWFKALSIDCLQGSDVYNKYDYRMYKRILTTPYSTYLSLQQKRYYYAFEKFFSLYAERGLLHTIMQVTDEIKKIIIILFKRITTKGVNNVF